MRPFLPTFALLSLVLLLACAEEHPAPLREAYFAYLDARSGGDGAEEIGNVLGGLGWSPDKLASAVERLRSEDPEGFRGLIDAYRASRGLPRDE